MDKSRTTRQKQLIFSIMQEAGEPLTAGDIFARAQQLQPTLAKSTVYRNLEAMQERGEVAKERLESGETFFLLVDTHTHRHYMICKGCNAMLDLPSCPMEKLEKEIAGTAGFQVTEHVIQLYGYCRTCAEKRRKDGHTP